MLYTRDIVYGLILPAVIAALILQGGFTPPLRRRPILQSALLTVALALAFMISYGSLYHRPPLPPPDTRHWLFYFPIPAAMLALLSLALRFPRSLTNFLVLILYCSVVLALFRRIFQNIPFPEAAEITVLLSLTGFLSYSSLRNLADRGRSTAIHFILLLVVAASAQVIMMSRTFTVGQTALILACALAGALPFVWWLSISWSPGPLIVVLILWHSLLIAAHFLSNLTALNAILLAAAPHFAWLAETQRVREWPKVPRVILRYTAPLIPMLTAQTLALLDHLEAQRSAYQF